MRALPPVASARTRLLFRVLPPRSSAIVATDAQRACGSPAVARLLASLGRHAPPRGATVRVHVLTHARSPKGRDFGLAVKWTETVSRCFNTYAVRPPVYSVIYNEKQTTSLTPVNPAFRGRILSSSCMSVRINLRGSGGWRVGLFALRARKTTSYSSVVCCVLKDRRFRAGADSIDCWRRPQ